MLTNNSKTSKTDSTKINNPHFEWGILYWIERFPTLGVSYNISLGVSDAYGRWPARTILL